MASVSTSTPPLSPTPSTPKPPAVVAGPEVIGRKISLLQPRPAADGWAEGVVVDYSDSTTKHLVKLTKDNSECWVHLGDVFFAWLSEQPPGAKPNPTFREACRGEACVGKRIKVFWPAMGKWYLGVVKAYDAEADKHYIAYKDGDKRAYRLQDEAVMWVDDDQQKGKENGLTSPSSVPPSPGKQACSKAKKISVSSKAKGKGALLENDNQAAQPSTSSSLELPTPTPIAEATSKQQNDFDVVEQAVVVGESSGKSSEQKAQGSKIQVQNGKVAQARDASTTSKASAASRHTSSASESLDRPPVPAPRRNVTTVLAGAAGGSGKAQCNGSVTSGAANGGEKRQAKGAANGQIPIDSKKEAASPNGSGANGKHQPAVNGKRKAPAACEETVANGKRNRIISHKLQNGSHKPPAAAHKAGKAQQSAAEVRESVVGARVGVLWEQDNIFYRGKLEKYQPALGKYQIRYDDGELEWLTLESESFQWFAPRGHSAGYSAAMKGVFEELGAKGMKQGEGEKEEGEEGGKQGGKERGGVQEGQGVLHKGEDAVGWHVQVRWPATGEYFPGEILAYDEKLQRHHVVYQDGEEEWLELRQESLKWDRMSRSSSLCAGIRTADTAPRGRAAIGWRIAVYWKDDKAFYEGRIIGYDNATGKHELLYDDHETEAISLHGERVVWKLPAGYGKPGSRNKGAGAKEGEDGEVEGRGPRTCGKRKRRGGLVAPAVSADSTDEATSSGTPTARGRGGRGGGRGRGSTLRPTASTTPAPAASTSAIAVSSRDHSRATSKRNLSLTIKVESPPDAPRGLVDSKGASGGAGGEDGDSHTLAHASAHTGVAHTGTGTIRSARLASRMEQLSKAKAADPTSAGPTSPASLAHDNARNHTSTTSSAPATTRAHNSPLQSRKQPPADATAAPTLQTTAHGHSRKSTPNSSPAKPIIEQAVEKLRSERANASDALNERGNGRGNERSTGKARNTAGGAVGLPNGAALASGNVTFTEPQALSRRASHHLALDAADFPSREGLSGDEGGCCKHKEGTFDALKAGASEGANLEGSGLGSGLPQQAYPVLPGSGSHTTLSQARPPPLKTTPSALSSPRPLTSPLLHNPLAPPSLPLPLPMPPSILNAAPIVLPDAACDLKSLPSIPKPPVPCTKGPPTALSRQSSGKRPSPLPTPRSSGAPSPFLPPKPTPRGITLRIHIPKAPSATPSSSPNSPRTTPTPNPTLNPTSNPTTNPALTTTTNPIRSPRTNPTSNSKSPPAIDTTMPPPPVQPQPLATRLGVLDRILSHLQALEQSMGWTESNPNPTAPSSAPPTPSSLLPPPPKRLRTGIAPLGPKPPNLPTPLAFAKHRAQSLLPRPPPAHNLTPLQKLQSTLGLIPTPNSRSPSPLPSPLPSPTVLPQPIARNPNGLPSPSPLPQPSAFTGLTATLQILSKPPIAPSPSTHPPGSNLPPSGHTHTHPHPLHSTKDLVKLQGQGSVRVASAHAPPTSATLRSKGWPPAKTSPPSTSNPTNGIRIIPPASSHPNKGNFAAPGSPMAVTTCRESSPFHPGTSRAGAPPEGTLGGGSGAIGTRGHAAGAQGHAASAAGGADVAGTAAGGLAAGATGGVTSGERDVEMGAAASPGSLFDGHSVLGGLELPGGGDMTGELPPEDIDELLNDPLLDSLQAGGVELEMAVG